MSSVVVSNKKPEGALLRLVGLLAHRRQRERMLLRHGAQRLFGRLKAPCIRVVGAGAAGGRRLLCLQVSPLQLKDDVVRQPPQLPKLESASTSELRQLTGRYRRYRRTLQTLHE